jgi:hypothetical protein
MLPDLIARADAGSPAERERLRPQLGREYAAWLQRQGRLNEVREELLRALEVAAQSRDNHESRLIVGYLGAIEERMGLYEAAREHQLEHLRLSRQAAIPGGMFAASISLASIALRAGDAAALDHELSELDRRAADLPAYFTTQRGREVRMQRELLGIARDARRGRTTSLRARTRRALRDDTVNTMEFRWRAFARIAAAMAFVALDDAPAARTCAAEARRIIADDPDARSAVLWGWERAALKAVGGAGPDR